MLQFWRKPGQKEKSHSSNLAPNLSPTSPTAPPRYEANFKSDSLDSTRSSLLASFEDEGLDIGENEVKEQSRLSKTLPEVLSDKAALGYFMQYLDTRSGVPYVQCWLDIDSFQTALENCRPLQNGNTRNYLSPLPSTKVDHDSLSVSTDCDSYTADSNSLCDYSTSTLSECKTQNDHRTQQDIKTHDSKGLTETKANQDIRGQQESKTVYEVSIHHEVQIHQEAKIYHQAKTHHESKNHNEAKNYNETMSYHDSKICEATNIQDTKSSHVTKSNNDTKIFEEVIFPNVLRTNQELKTSRESKTRQELKTSQEPRTSQELKMSQELQIHQEQRTSQEPRTIQETKISQEVNSIRIEKTKIELNNVCDSNISDSSPKSYKNNVKISYTDPEKEITRLLQEFTDDALIIFKKYIALEAPEGIKCPEDIRKEVIENICSNDKLLSSNCFEKVQKHVYNVLDKEYFESFLGSDYFCKYQIDILTSGNVVLEDILYNETALFYFMEFLEQENNRPLLDFWLAATNFQQQLHDQKEFFDPMEAQTDAVVLYDKYFSLQAHCPLGFGDKVRFAVEQNICGENGLMMDCFHLPLKIIEQVLENNYLKTFLASQLFYKYLSELINTVQCNGYSNLFVRNKSLPSDCSSEKSFCTNTTFLAMENPTRRVKKERGADMNIDTRQLYDPDSLWKRKKYHRLSFGRITELGRFETDFEPEPDKKPSSKLRNVVKKFVNIEEDKQKEEMAWQVAEMIVKDITSVTLTDPKLQES